MTFASKCSVCRKPLAGKQRSYCSNDCRYVGKRRSWSYNFPRGCQCCGKIFRPSRGYGKARFCSKSCVWKVTRGAEFNTKISRATAKERGDKSRGTGTRGYVKENNRHQHRTVAERKLGRALLKGEIVHHVDGDKHNNDPANLLVMTQSQHAKLHGFGQWRNK